MSMSMDAHAKASLRSNLSLYTVLRRAWASIALAARERGDRPAAAQAQRELIRCELRCVRYECQLALLAASVERGADKPAGPPRRLAR
jgi:hypothetical protein